VIAARDDADIRSIDASKMSRDIPADGIVTLTSWELASG
jgi:hypothetical protein